MQYTLIILLAALALAAPAAAQTDEELEAYAAEAFSKARWTHGDTGITAIIAGIVVAATAFDYSSCGEGFKAEDHPEYGTHCLLTLDNGETLTYNTKVQLRGYDPANPDATSTGEKMLYVAGGLIGLGIGLIALPDNPVTRDLEAGVAPGGAAITKSFGW